MQFEMKILIERNVCIFQLSYKSYKLSANYTVEIKHIYSIKYKFLIIYLPTGLVEKRTTLKYSSACDVTS